MIWKGLKHENIVKRNYCIRRKLTKRLVDVADSFVTEMGIIPLNKNAVTQCIENIKTFSSTRTFGSLCFITMKSSSIRSKTIVIRRKAVDVLFFF